MGILTLLAIALCFAIVGVLVYISTTLPDRSTFKFQHAIVCMLYSAAIPSGTFLILCALIPKNLFRVIPSPVNPALLLIDVEAGTSVCILVGGFCTVYLAIYNLIVFFADRRYIPWGTHARRRGIAIGARSAIVAQGEKYERLCGFFRDSFRPREFEIFLRVRVSTEVAAAVSTDGAGVNYFFEILAALDHRGLINTTFFDHLEKERPMKAEQIASLKELWLISGA